jgi:sulfate adenylyltransferase
MTNRLINPHGGELVDLVVPHREAETMKEESREWQSWDLTPRQICDLELLMNGGFSPLRGFMERKDYDGVVASMRLSGGELWPIPITLDVPESFAESVAIGETVALRDPEGVMLAAIQIGSIWKPDREEEAQQVYGTTDISHTGVDTLLKHTEGWCLGGAVRGVQFPDHYDSKALRYGPSELRREFERLGWRRIVAFQTRNPIHRAHFELTMRAIRQYEANLLIHPVVGMTKFGDVDHYTRVRCYQALLKHFPLHSAKLALLPLSMRMAGPRSAVWHAIIRKNYGCTHLIVGRDHAGPGPGEKGNDFYGPYEAQDLVLKLEKETGIEMVPFSHLVYVENRDRYMSSSEVESNDRVLNLSGTALRRRLSDGREIPAWFTFPEVAQELRRSYPPRVNQGFTVFFTGLSGSGKSTVAKVLQVKLLEMGGRPVTLLDGDVVRTNLSSELGFSREHRDLNILRIGFVANEITKNGGIAICAPIAPYDSVRKDVCSLIRERGGCILLHISTPLEVCEQRDRKGLYAKARAGIIKEFTGISDPYEEPVDADLKIDTTDLTPEEACQEILLHLENEGYVG